MTQINTTPAQITDFFCRKGENRQIIAVQNVQEYIDDALKSNRILCEYISYDKDVNPYFDADLKIDYKDDISKEEFEFRESKLKKECLDMVANIFETYDGNYQVFEGRKNYRLLYKKGKKVSYKFSLRFWIKGIKVKPQYLKMLLDQYQPINNSPFDNSVYNNGRVMIMPQFHKHPTDDDPSKTVLLPVSKEYNIRDFTITTIKDNDYNLNNDVKNIIRGFVDNPEKSSGALNEFLQSADIVFNPEEIIGKCKTYVNGFSKETADDYKKWCDIGFALKNTGVKYLFENKAFEMFRHFSKKSEKYEDDKILKQWQEFKVGGKKAAGLPTLAEYYKNDINKDTDEDLLNTQGYEAVKKEFEKNVCKILSDATFVRKDGDDVYFIKKETLYNTYENLPFWSRDKKEGLMKKPFVATWFKDENIRSYKKVAFDPSRTCGNDVYNLFTGFRAETLPPVPDEDVDEIIEPIIRHYKEVLYGEHWEYHVDLDRNIIQNPTEKAGVIEVLKGLQGIGKTIVTDELLRKRVIGKEFASQCGGISPLFDRFATETAKKLLCLCDEVNIKECIGTVGEKMKNLCTASTIQVETKGVNKITLDNHINLRLTSNNENPISIPHDDRRYVVFEGKSIYLQNVEYMDALVKACTCDKVARAYYQYLLRPIKVQNFQRERPKTEYYYEVVSRNLPPIDRFLSFVSINKRIKTSSLFENPNEEDKEFQDYAAHQLYISFVDWCKERRWENVITSTSFGTKIGGIVKCEEEAIVKPPRKKDGCHYVIYFDKLEKYLKANNRFDEDVF